MGERSESSCPVSTVQSQPQDLSAEMMLGAVGICALTGEKAGPSCIQNMCIALYSTHNFLPGSHASLSFSHRSLCHCSLARFVVGQGCRSLGLSHRERS